MYSGPKKVHTTSDEEVSAPESSQMTESDTMEQDEVKSETEASSVNDDQEGDSDDSDEGWITPENLHEACEVMGGALTEEPNDIAVGCITTDFAMQVYTHVYRIAGKFDGDLNLANWRFWTATAKVYSRQIYDLRTVMLPSASHRQI